MGMGVGKFIQI